ncbi:MAG: hypothetical protein KGS61_02375 [Verrucomicrobia bacterium]|nr:hypothetical protein [Verrucomicrobiota bacterium]
MKTIRPLLLAVAVTSLLLPASRLEGVEPDLGQKLATLQQQYLQGHLSASEYEQRKSHALHQRLDQTQQAYNRGDISQLECRRQTDAANQQYAAAFSTLSADQPTPMQAASARPPGVMPEQRDLSVLNAQAVDELQRLYFQGRISASQYEQIKLRAKEQVADEIDRQFYQGRISGVEARDLHRRLNQDYARLYSPLTRRELTELQQSFPPSSASTEESVPQSRLLQPTGSRTGREYATSAGKSKTEQLDELLRQYQQDKITPRQYQEQRARILALPQP